MSTRRRTSTARRAADYEREPGDRGPGRRDLDDARAHRRPAPSPSPRPARTRAAAASSTSERRQREHRRDRRVDQERPEADQRHGTSTEGRRRQAAPDDRTKHTKTQTTTTGTQTDTGDREPRSAEDCAGASRTTDSASTSGHRRARRRRHERQHLRHAPGRFVSAFVPRKRRGAELFLLILALIISVSSYALVGLGRDGTVPTDIIEYGGCMVGAGVVCHIAVRFRAPYADPVLLPAVVALNGIGLAMIRRIDLGQRHHRSPASSSSGPALSIAGFVGTLALIRDHRRLQAFTYTLGFVGIGAAAAAAAPGARRQHQRRPHLGPARRPVVPARRDRQDLPGDLLRRLPRREARRARAGRSPLHRHRPARAAATSGRSC